LGQSHSKFEVLTVVLHRIQVVWNVMLCCWANSYPDKSEEILQYCRWFQKCVSSVFPGSHDINGYAAEHPFYTHTHTLETIISRHLKHNYFLLHYSWST